MQYIVQATINGRAMKVLVDTGANVVALNSEHATALGVDFSAGKCVLTTILCIYKMPPPIFGLNSPGLLVLPVILSEFPGVGGPKGPDF